MRDNNTRRSSRFPLTALAAALALGWTCQAHAFEFDTGNRDLTIRFDNTLRYNLGMRMEAQDARILANPSYDEGDAKFGKHDIVTNRLDLLTEFDLNYKGQLGARMSAASWYDRAYQDHSVTSTSGFPTSYVNNQYNSTVDRYVNGPSGEILDAFLWSDFNAGGIQFNVKLGRHTIIWGEGLLLGQHAISYSQSPADGVKAATSPGIETKEVFLPLQQISMKAQVSDNLSLAAQYFFEWKSLRAPHGGTYLSGSDTSFEVDRLGVSPTFAFNRAASLQPRNRGNYGVNAKYNVDAIDANVGLYFRRFDDYQPWTNVEILGAAGPFRFVYPKAVKLIGLSLGKSIGPVSAGFEVSYRKDAALNAAGISTVDNEGPRGNTWHAIASGIYLLPNSKFWDTGSLTAELAYSRLDKVTSHPELYKAEGYNCVNNLKLAGDRTDGCSTKDYLGMAVNFAPSYFNIMPSWNMDLPMSINYGLHGNAPTGGGGYEKAVSWSAGVKMTFRQNHEFSLRYADSGVARKYNSAGTMLNGGNSSGGGLGATDRGWLAFTYKTGF